MTHGLKKKSEKIFKKQFELTENYVQDVAKSMLIGKITALTNIKENKWMKQEKTENKMRNRKSGRQRRSL